LHDNFGAGHNSLSSISETITEFGRSISYQFTKSFASIVSFFFPSQQIEYYTETLNDFSGWRNHKLKYIIKFGFDVTFNW